MDRAAKEKQIVELTADLVHEWLTKGLPAVGPLGKPILDEETGEQVYRPVTPRSLPAIVAYIKTMKPKVEPKADENMPGVAGKIQRASAGRGVA